MQLIHSHLKTLIDARDDLNIDELPGLLSPDSDNIIINSSVVKWEEKDVEDWVAKNNIRSSILDNIRPCNGELLYELFSIKTKAPDYFYESLMASEYVVDEFSLRDYAVFFSELKKLFLV